MSLLDIVYNFPWFPRLPFSTTRGRPARFISQFTRGHPCKLCEQTHKGKQLHFFLGNFFILVEIREGFERKME